MSLGPAVMSMRGRWLRGLCPCCGSTLDNGVLGGAGPTTVGEGVQICGLCVDRGHDRPDIVAVLLAELLKAV